MAPLLRAIGTLNLALPTILLSGCASPPAGTSGSDCEEWGTRVEAVKVCNSKGLNCSIEQQSVEYCARTKGQRAALSPKEARAPEKAAKPAPATPQPEQARRTPAQDKGGVPDLTPFWQSLFSASRYPGLRYGKVRKVTTSPAAAPASSTQVEAALKTHVRSVVSMQVASDSKSTPMEHRLAVMVYRANNRAAAVALYTAMLRDEWRDRKPQAQAGVTYVVVNTADKKHPGASGQRMVLQRGPYVVEVDEWKSIYRDAAGKPVPGKQFPHSDPISPGVVAKAVVSTFPAE